MPKAQRTKLNYSAEIITGLTVSIVALSLGGAFGLLSGRGVVAGMLSAALYPLITSLLGGTKIQCSGPTGPMTTVFIAVMASATESLGSIDTFTMIGFLNMTLFLMAGFLCIGGILRIGNWVKVVPNVVISGFMDGIALIIWLSQSKKLLQTGSSVIEGPILTNCIVAIVTCAIAWSVSRFSRQTNSHLGSLLSGTLVALVVMTLVSSWLTLPIERATADISLHSWSEFSEFFTSHSPNLWPWHLVWLAIPLAAQLAGVTYLDTLLTSLIIDKKTNTTSKRNQELVAQGIATSVIAFIGGVPGAQATERSVLMLKEGAQSRLAGVLVGVFGLVGVLLLQDVVSFIPKAVFAGVLLNVGYDVFDWQPLRKYFKGSVSHFEIALVLLTAAITTTVNVMVAVFIGTALFFVLQKLRVRGFSDLQADELEGVSDEP